MKIKNAIGQIAKKYGVTPEEVKKEIEDAIRLGMASKDPIAQEQW